MKALRVIMAALPAAMLVAQPALAAEPAASGATRTSAFAGVQLKLNLGETKRVTPTARLKLGMTHHSNDFGSTVQARDGGSLELGLSRLGRADLYVGGQKLTDMQKRLGIAPAAVALIVVGVATVGAVAVSQSQSSRDPKTGCPPGVEVCTQ